MYPQADGDVLEKGNMQNPSTGQSCEYEEVWHDLEIRMLKGESQRVCIVLEADFPSTGTKGMLMRIGDWCQGILKTTQGMTIERWQWLHTESPHGDQGHDSISEVKWTRLAKFGSGSLPSPIMLSLRNLVDGSKVESGGIEWSLVENYQW